MPEVNGRRPGPLEGVRVLEFSEIIAAPFCGMLLADMGADVIKVEPPGGEPWRGAQPLGLRESRWFISLNRGKRGVTLDLQQPEGREIAWKLADRADVVIVNYRPDVSEKLGIDEPTLRARNPRLIYCDNTAFGRRGPWAHRPGYDIIAQAVTGLMTLEGKSLNGVPQVNTLPAADYSTGLAMAWGICAALYVRERTGVGQRVDTTLLGSALAVQTSRFLSVEAVDAEPRANALARLNELRANGASYEAQLEVIKNVRPVLGNIYYRCYQTADGFIAVGALSTPLRRKVLDVLGMDDRRLGKPPPDPNDPEEVRYGEELVKRAEAIVRERPTAEWLERFDRAGVPAGPVVFTEELLEDPQVLANDLVVQVEHPLLGPVRMVGAPIQMTETPLRVRGCSPLLGQHNEEVLTELGYSPEEIDALRARGVINGGIEDGDALA
ncbi:MAG TPA: CoA transferase [Dehalococcoidia bacterium]|nr:CoA transferase [Dehalococcoidia bacterium]